MMRLWHYKLIPVLPNAMLVSQWRECIAIKRQWEKGILKHRLVSYVMNYDKKYFYSYIRIVECELKHRNIKCNNKFMNEMYDFCQEDFTIDNIMQQFYYPEHNDKYFIQCYYNLEEKHDRGIISDEEWEPINHLYWDLDDEGYY